MNPPTTEPPASTRVMAKSTTTTSTVVLASPSLIETPPGTTESLSAPSQLLETTTSTPDAPLLPASQKQYGMYDHGGDVVQLQVLLGLKSVDGIYGPITRQAHIDHLGGPVAAIRLWFPDLALTSKPCSHGCHPGDSHYELPTLTELVDKYFHPEDRGWAIRVAFCESSGQPKDVGSDKVSSALAVGWFQHLARFWMERSKKAGWERYHPFHAEANVAVAAWLFYEGGGARHWNPSRTCWEKTDGSK